MIDTYNSDRFSYPHHRSSSDHFVFDYARTVRRSKGPDFVNLKQWDYNAFENEETFGVVVWLNCCGGGGGGDPRKIYN